jgi:hypothetical protein
MPPSLRSSRVHAGVVGRFPVIRLIRRLGRVTKSAFETALAAGQQSDTPNQHR